MSKNRKNVLICGNYGIGNLGDEAILEGIIRLVKSAELNSKITVFSSDPKKTANLYNVEAINYFPAGIKSTFKFWLGGKFFRTIKTVWAADLVILGGGGLFSDEKPRAVWIWFVQFLWFYLMRKKLFCMGQSLGPLKTGFGKKLTAFVFRHASAITVRDQQSKLLLEKLKIKGAEVLADPAYAIGYDAASFNKRNDYAVLSLRQWIRSDNKTNPEIAALVDWLFETYQLKTLFIAFQKNEDLPRFDQIKSLLKNPSAMELADGKMDYKLAIELISRAKIVIGMRLHSVIFSVITKTPFLALSYSSKVRDFVKTLDLENYLDYEELSLDILKASAKEILEEGETLSKYLEKQKLHFTYEVFKHEQILKNLLK